MPKMQYYDVGLGSAFTRTQIQKKLAKNYTKAIVEQAYDNIIFVDGSINTKDNPHYNKYSQEGCVRRGGILISKDLDSQVPHTYFREQINTHDPQLAELQGILRALQLNQPKDAIMKNI